MFENKNSRTELSELGEFGLIKHLSESVILKNPSTLKGIGDDAAVIACDDSSLVVTTDLLTEGIHFDLSYCPLKHLGYKSIVVNLSDIYAMNANPQQVTVSIALSNRFSLEAVEELYAGINLACERYGVDLVGGDTSSSSAGLVISVTAIGTAQTENITYRSGAMVGDIICVSGDLGAAFLGLQILEREKRIFMESPAVQPQLEGKDYLIERQLKPEAARKLISQLADIGLKPHAMIDISDGLSSDILHICHESGVGCKLYEEKIPVDHLTYETARELHLDPTVCALNGGEDYELLFTVPIKEFEKVNQILGVSIIGHIVEKQEGCYLIDRSDRQVPLVAQGWNAFTSKAN